MKNTVVHICGKAGKDYGVGDILNVEEIVLLFPSFGSEAIASSDEMQPLSTPVRSIRCNKNSAIARVSPRFPESLMGRQAAGHSECM